jgi:hypothetical protein
MPVAFFATGNYRIVMMVLRGSQAYISGISVAQQQ